MTRTALSQLFDLNFLDAHMFLESLSDDRLTATFVYSADPRQGSGDMLITYKLRISGLQLQASVLAAHRSAPEIQALWIEDTSEMTVDSVRSVLRKAREQSMENRNDAQQQVRDDIRRKLMADLEASRVSA